MIFRMVNEQRLPQVMDLWDYSFEKKEDPFFQWYFTEFCCKNNMVLGGFDDEDKLQNMLHLNPYMLRIRGFEQLVPYIVGVATAPAARGQHLFKPLLETAFQVLRSQKFPFVILMPVFAGIYLPYEFAYCYNRHAYSFEIDKLKIKHDGNSLNIKYLPVLDKDILAKIYYNITKEWNGVPIRTDFQWEKLLKVHSLEHVSCAVCWQNEQPVGYMLYKIENKIFNIIELLAEDQSVKNKLLHYVSMHKSEADEIKWLAEEWDKTYLSFADQAMTGSLQPFMMARCIDARLALAKLPVPDNIADFSLNLLLVDNVIDENNHLLKIAVSDGQLTAVSTMDEEDVTMNIAVFTQMYFGAYTAGELYEAGYIKCGSREKLECLDKLFPKCRNYINEYF